MPRLREAGVELPTAGSAGGPPIQEGQQSPPSPRAAAAVSFVALFRFAKVTDRWLMFLGLLGAFGAGFGMPLYSLVFGVIIDEFGSMPLPDEPGYDAAADHLLDVLVDQAVYLVLIGIGLGLCTWLSLTCWMYSAESQALRVRKEYVKSVLGMDMSYMDDKSQGELVSILNEEITRYQDGIGEKLSIVLQSVFTFFISIGIAMFLGWQMALVVLGVVPVMTMAFAIIGKLMVKVQTRESSAYEALNQAVDETLTGIRTVTAFGAQQKEIERTVPFLEEAYKSGVRKNSVAGLLNGVVMCIIFSSFGFAMWFGHRLIVQGTISPSTGEPYTGGDVMSVFMAVLFGAISLGQAGPNMPSIMSSRSAAHTLYEIIDRDSDIDPFSDQGDTLDDSFSPKIVLDSVHFRYPTRPEVKIFQGVELQIRPGEKVALVGHSGSGKSTVIQLLQRFYDPEQGRVLVDGHDLRHLNVSNWRSHVGIVSQEPVLFEGTVHDNILYGKFDATKEEVVAAAKLANAHDFIKRLPEGYQTGVGEGGSRLSGGQKQRIAIARAVIKNPKVLLLDEATSALDNESEKVVQKGLDRLMRGRTTVIVAHRLSTIRNADRIFVFSDGTVVEHGTHQELLDKRAAYFHLIQSQEKQDDDYSPTPAAVNRGGRISMSATGRYRRASSVEASSFMGMSFEMETHDEPAEKARGKTRKKEMHDNEVAKDASNVKWDVPSVPMRRLWSYVAGDWGYMLLGTVGSAINGGFQPVFAILFGEMIELLFAPDDTKAIIMASLFAALGLVLLVSTIMQSLGFAVPGQRMTKTLREQCFRSILRQEMAFFDEDVHSARVLAARLSMDASRVNELAVVQLKVLVQTACLVLTGLAIAFYHSWHMALVMLGLFPLIAVGVFVRVRMAMRRYAKSEEHFAKAGATAAEAFDNLRTVASFTAEQQSLDRYCESLVVPLQAARQSSVVSGAAAGFSQLCSFGSYAICYYAGAQFVSNGYVEFGDMMSAIFAVILAASGAGQVQSAMPDLAAAKLSKDYIFYMIDRASAIDPSSDKGDTAPVQTGDVHLNQVKFAYPTRPAAPVLKGVDVDVSAGQSVALVGESGSGKSTIVQLLLRFYDAHDGQVTVGGKQVQRRNVNTLRQCMGLVSQEPHLFDVSIRENIAYGQPDASQEEIETAAKAANIHDVIMEFPAGYATKCGPRGSKLSGGQKQRVAIARALIRNPRVLLLDEATSALDSESEAVVQAALDRLIREHKRTTLMIAHRLSTVRNCDVIIVMDKGSVVEIGSHAELITRDGVYASLWRMTGASES